MKTTASALSPHSQPQNGVKLPVAVVMNMFYTGLGIARSLGQRGVPVIGLSAHNIYGNYTRYADVRRAPNSRDEPEILLQFLLRLGREIGGHSILFPTRDDDVLFLDRFREELSASYIPVIPFGDALHACLDKWQTYVCARGAGVPVPRTWRIEQKQDLVEALGTVTFPCLLKPLSSSDWRRNGNWERVGARKAICIASSDDLMREYDQVAAADQRVLLQEVVPGDDARLLIAACYIDRKGNLAASFTAQKLLQLPEGFGTGCIVQAVDRQDLIPLAVRLLKQMRFTGIAEVEFKWDASDGQYKLIEVNARPWDQHRLGRACRSDLIQAAYFDFAGLSLAKPLSPADSRTKWIAEDAFLLAAFRSLWRRDGNFIRFLRLARGKRIYGIWSARDPLPFIMYAIKTMGAAVGILFRRFSCTLRDRREPARVPIVEKSEAL